MKKFPLVLLVVVVLLQATVFVVLAQGFAQEEGPASYSLTDILLWILAGPGTAWLVGVVLTQILENLPFWHNLPSQLKFGISMGLAALFPILAQVLLAWPGLATIEPWVNTAINAIVIWLASQKQYRTLKLEAAQGARYGAKIHTAKIPRLGNISPPPSVG